MSGCWLGSGFRIRIGFKVRVRLRFRARMRVRIRVRVMVEIKLVGKERGRDRGSVWVRGLLCSGAGRGSLSW